MTDSGFESHEFGEGFINHDPIFATFGDFRRIKLSFRHFHVECFQEIESDSHVCDQRIDIGISSIPIPILPVPVDS